MQKLSTSRNTSIDLLRGFVMIIMALDHTREFFHAGALTQNPLDPATTTPILFFTRWITHFCAPTFVFLSGVSAYLSSSRKPKKAASSMLVKRGLFLIIAEITVVSFGLGFNPMMNFIFLQVIWVIGMSLVLLGLLMRVSRTLILVIGIILFFGHNVLDFFNVPRTGVEGALWNLFFLAKGSVIPYAPGRIVLILYALLPWTGVMFMGYSIGHWFAQSYPQAMRVRNLLIAGGAMLLLFLLLRLTGVYGDPVQWTPSGHWMMSLLDTEKYPPSLQFLGMTLGPALLFLGLFEMLKPTWGEAVQVYGRVPFFYYILHFYLSHTLLMVLFLLSDYPMSAASENIILFRPNNFGYSLPVVYLIWAIIVLSLFFPCRWYYRYKMSHNHWWLKYI